MNYRPLYADFLKRFLSIKRPIKVIFDCSGGSTAPILKSVFAKKPAIKSTYINDRPDPLFRAHSPDPTGAGVIRQLQKIVVRKKADLGVIFDGDGDRAYFVDNLGRLIPSFLIAYLLFLESKPPFVSDTFTYKSLSLTGLLYGKTFISPVGSYFIKKLMRQKNANRGAEYSGHYYFKEFFSADSGILAAIKIINAVSRMPYSSAEFVDLQSKIVHSKFFNVHTQKPNSLLLKMRKHFSGQAIKIKAFDGLTFDFKDAFLIVRPSNTEPLVRIFIAALSKNSLARLFKDTRRLL